MTGEDRKPRNLRQYVTWSSTVVSGLVLWGLDTFTVQGFLSSLYLAPTEAGMWWPTGTRIVWWVLFYLGGSLFVQRLMWREAVRTIHHPVQLWAASHVDAVKRIIRRIVWWRDGLRTVRESRRRHRPAEVPVTVPGRSRTVPETPETPAAAA